MLVSGLGPVSCVSITTLRTEVRENNQTSVSDFPIIFYNYLEYMMWGVTQVSFCKFSNLDTQAERLHFISTLYT